MSEFQLVGRERELEQLSGFLERAIEGQTSVCLLTGEPGAGKSSLLMKFAEVAVARHPELLVARGECDAVGEAGDPYLPFREILRDLTGEQASHPGEVAATLRTDSSVRRLFRMSAAKVLEYGPDLIDIFVPGAALVAKLGGQAAKKIAASHARQSAGEPSAANGAGINQDNIFEQYVQVLKAIAKENPMVLMLDDLHWADSGSVGLLFHLARRLVSSPVLIIGAYRAAEVRQGRGGEPHPLTRVISELKRIHGRIQIDLDEQDHRAFLDALLDSAPNRLDDGFRRELLERTGGNPLFAVELLSSLQTSGVLVVDQGGRLALGGPLDWTALPSRIEGVIEGSVERLTPQQREILDIACVQGEEFTADVTARVLGQTRRELIKQLSGALQRDHEIVNAAGLQQVGDSSVAVYRFRHNLFQRYLYEALDELEAASLHEEVGVALEQLHAGNESVVAVPLAHHFARTPEWRKSLRYTVLAGDRARAAYAPREAAAYYTRAAALFAEHPGAEPETGISVAAVMEYLGDQRSVLGEHEAALEAYRQAAAATVDDVPYSQARIHTRMSVPLQRLKDYGQANAVLDAAAGALDSVRDITDRAWWQCWIDIRLERAYIQYWTADMAGLGESVAAMKAPIEEWGSLVQRSKFVDTLARQALRETRYRPGPAILELLSRTVDTLDPEASPSLRMNELFQLGFASLWAERLQESTQAFARSIALYRLCGDSVLKLRDLVYLSVALRRLGRPSEVEQNLSEATVLADQLDAPEYRGLLAAQNGWLALVKKERATAWSETERAITIWNKSGPRYPFKWTALWVRVALHFEDGDYRAVTPLVSEMLEPPQARQPPDIEDVLHGILAVREAGDPELQRQAIAAALELARERRFL